MRKLTAVLFIILFIAVSNVLSQYGIPGYSTHTFNRTINGGYTFSIAGDGSTNLDLYVYGGGQLIGRAESSGDRESVYAPGSGTVQVVVVNRGGYMNRYAANF
jgi:hypothetical protein